MPRVPSGRRAAGGGAAGRRATSGPAGGGHSARMCGSVRNGALEGHKGDESYKMLLTYLFYIDLLRYSHRESTRRNPQLARQYLKALIMGTICPFVGPATDKQGA